jgi:alkyl sulfatase BDS1-like metallo-beta-lactamase superfamily hydrolase
MGESPYEAASSQSIEPALEALVTRMNRSEARAQEHSIRLQLSGQQGGMWAIETVEGQLRLVKGPGSATPRAEVHADAATIRRVLDGEVDGRAAFLSGGILVRGDVASLERLSAALGTHAPAGA